MFIKDTLVNGAKMPLRFAPWAMAKSSDLTVARKRVLLEDGTVRWQAGQETGACADHLELSGFYTSAILSYGRDRRGRLRLMRHLVVPTLRKKPDVTQSSFSCNFSRSPVQMAVNGKKLWEFIETVDIRGTLHITSGTNQPVRVERELLPAAHCPGLIEIVTLSNNSASPVKVDFSGMNEVFTLPAKKCVGAEIRAFTGYTTDESYIEGTNVLPVQVALLPGQTYRYYCVYSAAQDETPQKINITTEIEARRNFIESMFGGIRLESPSKLLNRQFTHCVLRGSESIFETKNGLMHAPGGGNYYAALWTNDQCEYANPFFPYSGYEAGIKQAINCYNLYGAYMDRSDKPMKDKNALVSSIIAQGDSYWNGAGDRGDGEMYAYGLARFLLAMGDLRLMERFYDNLSWCMEFTLSRKTAEGVIASDADELENRFPSGNANLFTACLAYDALGNAALIAEILGHEKQAQTWRVERTALADAIERYFGRDVEGYHTYRYYDGNTSLRAWICMPLTVELFGRTRGTVEALYSERLFKDGMLKTDSGHKTTWDRSLLFALRGTLLAGETEQGTKALLNYCQNRLLGTHAPYPFEAYPEGNRAHLAAESILFARIVTEGLFGLRPTGYRQLRIEPRLSADLPWLALKNLRLFGLHFDIKADDDGITIIKDGLKYHTVNSKAVFDFEQLKFVR